jgi:hypothetical protein
VFRVTKKARCEHYCHEISCVKFILQICHCVIRLTEESQLPGDNDMVARPAALFPNPQKRFQTRSVRVASLPPV